MTSDRQSLSLRGGSGGGWGGVVTSAGIIGKIGCCGNATDTIGVAPADMEAVGGGRGCKFAGGSGICGSGGNCGTATAVAVAVTVVVGGGAAAAEGAVDGGDAAAAAVECDGLALQFSACRYSSFFVR